MQKIIPYLWFDTQAKEAAELYVSIIPDSQITAVSTIHNTPSGDCDIVSFTLAGRPFVAISAGPTFTFNPSISFTISCQTTEAVDAVWNKLITGGKALMEIGEYPFSKRYGWLSDKYGLSWQIIVGAAGVPTQTITPGLMFTQDVAGRSEEAMQFYTSLFKDSTIEHVFRYKNQLPDKDGTIVHALFRLGGAEFIAMDSAGPHQFSFSEAISLLVPCETQQEIDYYWSALSAVPESEQCGWCKDKFGVSWQVWPTALGTMMSNGSPEQVDRVTKAFLQMKKFDIAALERAFEGK